MASSVPESVFELGIEFSEANTVLLMSLMEETQEDDDQYYGDDRLVSMIQSLEAEISDPLFQRYEMGHVDDHDCSTSSVNGINWVDVELISSSPFDEMNAWIPCGNEMEDVAMDYEAGNDIDYFQSYSGVFLEQQQHRETYLSQGTSHDAIF